LKRRDQGGNLGLKLNDSLSGGGTENGGIGPVLLCNR
jgi:hypothetical protein